MISRGFSDGRISDFSRHAQTTHNDSTSCTSTTTDPSDHHRHRRTLLNMGRGGYKQINKALNICAFEDYLDSQVASLPRLNDVEQITPRVLRILGQNEGKVWNNLLTPLVFPS